ncbi:MAG: hypothetical protein R3E11_01215 [Sphingobium sp.]|nr:hypothetical protein [Sphingobium sp.]MCP5400170.1 hypothetical protein [Sphingomonas sp.]
MTGLYRCNLERKFDIELHSDFPQFILARVPTAYDSGVAVHDRMRKLPFMKPFAISRRQVIGHKPDRPATDYYGDGIALMGLGIAENQSCDAFMPRTDSAGCSQEVTDLIKISGEPYGVDGIVRLAMQK